ncbi:Peptidyl-prolyl cis-trans isomerase FKBP16-3, chloroplastic, partial [Sesamum angolense]
VLDQGYILRDIKVGGGRSPPVGFQVAANYVAMVPSGQIFDSAFESPEGSDDEDNVTDVAKLDTTYLLTNGNVKINSAVAESENYDYGASIYAAEFLCAAEILQFANYGCCILLCCSNHFINDLMAPVIYCYLQRLAKCGENKARNYTVATYSHKAPYLLTGGNVVRCSGTENENALTNGSDDEDNVIDVSKLDTTYLLTNGMWGKWKSVTQKFNSAVAESENSDYGASIYAEEFLCAAEILRFANYGCCILLCCSNHFVNVEVSQKWGKQCQKLYCRNLQPQRSISSYWWKCGARLCAFESPEGSDDEDNVTDVSKLDTTYLLTNGNVKFNSAVAESENSDYDSSDYKICEDAVGDKLKRIERIKKSTEKKSTKGKEKRLAKCGENKARNYTSQTTATTLHIFLRRKCSALQ